MRRVVGIVLLTLGVFALTFGVLLRTVVYDQLAVAPLDPDVETVAQGTGMTVFYPASAKDTTIEPVRTDATVTARRVVGGKLDAQEVVKDGKLGPDTEVLGDVALWRVGLVVEDENKNLVNAVEQWVCVDRRTAEGVKPCSQQKVDDGSGQPATTEVDMSGLNYKFPFRTEQKNYTFFDITLRKATPISYNGTETINGLDTYRFVQTIEPVQLDTREVPGALVNQPGVPTVSATRWYSNVRTLWVEPLSGTIVKGQEQVRQVLRGPDGQDGQVLLAGTLTFTDQTVARQVDSASEAAGKLRLLTSTGPWTAWILGALLIAGALFLLFGPDRYIKTRHRRGRAPEPVTERVPVG
ncbi:DUF3068 domain-containing protein [Spirilliplanes yamanashiensis]|uniref:DUF3068 domain-containing protein n=1 Tax=Spirilliplanes yamanashiensis TaxID=42233 RepID=A0A8J3Y656_9ACTN|nr:DUF3068 domain-containing protein [Spirilliplanes yamanashiensis]MDP9814420.1 hypothetical protein [Spirilliplanes yamanashiensis]GIJ02072.1 hypothetical protein Sya03_14240 [Spirilliplanes yamanashiensis]